MKSVVYILTFLALVASQTVSGQTGSKSKIYQAFVSGRMAEWEKIMVNLDNEAMKKKDAEFLAELINFQYGYIGWCIGNKLKVKAEQYLSSAENNLEVLNKMEPGSSRVLAYRGAFQGFRIGLNKYKAMILGPKSKSNIDLALQKDPGNPAAWVEAGHATYYMPAAFGGSKSKAIESMEKAISLMEKTPAALVQNWFYLNTLVTLAQWHEETGQIQKAKQYYLQLIKLEPSFQWVRNELYPAFQKKHKL